MARKSKHIITEEACVEDAVSGAITDLEDLASEIETVAAQRTVQPPVGWAVHGRGRYECRECLAARGQAPD